MFNNLNDNVAVEEDRIGGGFAPFETGIYKGTIKMAYGDFYKSGAMFLQLAVELEDGREYRERLTLTNKQGKNFYVDKNGVERGLPGFTVANDICLLTTGEPLSSTETEEKQVMVYDFDLGKEVPQAKNVLTAIIGQPIALAINKIIKNKTAKNAAGDYVDTNEEQVINEITKVMHPETKHTTTELRNGVEEPIFWDQWLEKNEGKDVNKFKEVGAKTGPAAFGAKAPTSNGGAKPNPFKKS